MDKISFNICPDDWGHLITKYGPASNKLTVADFSDGTVNIESDANGSLTKRKGGPNYNTTLLSAPPKDQFEAIFSDGTRHLLVVANGEIRYSSGDTIFNSVVNGTGFSATGNFEFATTQDRVYMGNGITAPQVYDRAVNYGGVSYTAPRMKVMGAQAPTTAPTPNSVSAGGAVPVGSHTWKVTFLYYGFEESNGGPASGVLVVAAPNQIVNFTGTIPVGGYGVTARKIYRDNNDGLWLHVGTINDNTTVTFSDSVAVGVTPTEIPESNDAPPSFSRLTLWLDQLWVSGVAGDPSTLFYSDTSRPDIFPDSNQVLCNQEDPITAHIVYFDRLIVFNRRSMGQILGKTSDTYRYAALPSSVGCVDNRTLQIRVIQGVPVLIWLSDRGFYRFDGSSIDYISDEIEDLVNFNIQQALQQKNSAAQSTFGGTAEDGISLSQIPGSITTRGYLNGTSAPGTNPKRTWDDQGDWEGGSINTNTATKAGDNLLKVPIRYAPPFAGGTFNNTIISGSNLVLPTTTPIIGESQSSLRYLQDVGTSQVAYPFIKTRAGTLNNVSFDFLVGRTGGPYSLNYTVSVWIDVGGLPGTEIFTSPVQTALIISTSTLVTVTNFTTNVAIAANTKYWFGYKLLNIPGNSFISASKPTTALSGGDPRRFFSGAWQVFRTDILGGASTTAFEFAATPVPAAGNWISPVYDSLSAFISTGMTFTTSSIYSPIIGIGRQAQAIIEGSNDAVFTAGAEISQTFINPNGPLSLTLSGKRYWRIRLTLSTTNDTSTLFLTPPILKFNTTSTWESETIDTTLQSTTYVSLALSASIPSGTSVTMTIATSTSPSGPWTYVAFGSHVVRQYVRIRLVLVADTTDVTTPFVSSVIFKWVISAKYTSTIIDTAVNPPAGWDLFLSDFTTNGGTVTFEMRSATTSGGIPAATFFTVTPSEFPTVVPPNQFTQWRVTLVAADEDVPQVDSVTVQWFIATVNSIRPASIFVDGRYYVALAEFGSLVNNILLQIDLNGKWRRMAGLSINTFSFFYNRPYFGLATSGQIRKFLDGTTDAGVAITFDWRTKAFDFSTKYQDNTSKVKVVGEVVLNGQNTGATYQVFYSIDNGETFVPMYTSTGASSYVSANNTQEFYVRFRPLWDGSNPIAGRTIMYRVLSNDLNEVEIFGLEVLAFLRKQAPVITG